MLSLRCSSSALKGSGRNHQSARTLLYAAVHTSSRVSSTSSSSLSSPSSSTSSSSSSLPCLASTLRERGLYQESTSSSFVDIQRHFLKKSQCLYAGFDPTADSLHLGHLLVIMVLKHAQLHGHQPIALVGGATGQIGDPSGRSTDRPMMTYETLQHNMEGIKRSLAPFLYFSETHTKTHTHTPFTLSQQQHTQFQYIQSTLQYAAASHIPPALLLNNLDWFGSMNVLNFLRDIGRHFRVSNMLNKESVKMRMESTESSSSGGGGGDGISYTEFSYSLLQSYDFAHLYKTYNTTAQIGGSDQWGNILSGLEYIRRLKVMEKQKQGNMDTKATEEEEEEEDVYGITVPLLVSSSGVKFGKSMGNTSSIWLDAKKTSPYQLFQYLVNNIEDNDVERYFKLFTLLPLEQIKELCRPALHHDTVHGTTKTVSSDTATATTTSSANLATLQQQIQSTHQLHPRAQFRLAEEIVRLIHGEEGVKSAKLSSSVLFGKKVSDVAGTSTSASTSTSSAPAQEEMDLSMLPAQEFETLFQGVPKVYIQTSFLKEYTPPPSTPKATPNNNKNKANAEPKSTNTPAPIPTTSVSSLPPRPITVPDLAVLVKAVKTKAECRRLISSGGLYINNKRVTVAETPSSPSNNASPTPIVDQTITKQDFIHEKFLLLRSGKKSQFLVILKDAE